MKRIACLVAALAIGSFGVVGCKEEPAGTSTDPRTPGQKAGDAVGGAVQGTVDKANEVGKSATQKAGEIGGAATQRASEIGGAATRGASDLGGAATRSASDAATGASAVLAPSGSGDISGVRNAVEGVVTNAVNRNDWKDMTDHLSSADRERLNASKPDTAGLDTLISGFKDKWRGKYTDVFSVMSAAEVYDPSFMALSGGTAAGGGDSTTKTATATIAASHGLPALTVPVVSEGGKWRIDIPDSVSAQQLHDNLAAALRDLQKDPAAWPADKKQAYQLVTHRLLMAVMNEKAGS